MNEKVLTKKQIELINENYDLLDDYVKKTINDKKIPHSIKDDFISEMFFRFCKSAIKYNESRGVKFSTYAYGGFKFGLDKVLNSKKFTNLCSTETLLLIEKDNKIIRNDDLKIDSELIHNVIKKVNLTDKELNTLKDYYFNLLTFEEIGLKYGQTKQAAKWSHQKALKKIKQFINNKNIEVDEFYEKNR